MSDSPTTKFITHSFDDYAPQGVSVNNRISQFELHAIKSLNLPILHIQPQHIQSIATAIFQSTIANNLTCTAALLFYGNQRHFHLYTDGSLQTSVTTSNSIPILGAA